MSKERAETERSKAGEDWLGLGTSIFKGLGEVKDSSKPEAPKSLESFKPASLDRELNPFYKNGGDGLPVKSSSGSSLGYEFGDDGHSWRMMKLRRLFEEHEASGTPIAELAVLRYGNMERYQAVLKERHCLETTGRAQRVKEFQRANRRSRKSTPSSRNHEKSTDFCDSVAQTKHAVRHDDKRTLAKRPYARDPQGSTTISKARALSGSSPSRSRLVGLASAAAGNASAVKSSYLLKAEDQEAVSAGIKSTPVDLEALKAEAEKLKGKMLRAKVMAPAEFPCLLKEYNDLVAKIHSAEDSTLKVAPVISGAGEVLPLHFGKLTASGTSLHSLARQERLGIGEARTDADTVFAQHLLRGHGYNNNLDEMDDAIGVVKPLTAKKQTAKEMKARQADIDRVKAIERAHQNCGYCNPKDYKKNVRKVFEAEEYYVAVCGDIGFHPYYCIIVPKAHVSSSLMLDENEMEALTNCFDTLRQFLASLNPPMKCVFYESTHEGKAWSHTVIECIPVTCSVYPTLSGYIIRAFETCESEEWSLHRKVIDTRIKKFQKSLPRQIPYAHFWLDKTGGFAHVIEQPERWKEDFGREVIASAAGLDLSHWRRRKHADLTAGSTLQQTFIESYKSFSLQQ